MLSKNQNSQKTASLALVRKLFKGVVSIPRPMGSYPQGFLNWVVWSDTATIVSAGSSFTAFSIRMNALFDFDPLVGGTLPAWYTNLAAAFRRYLALLFGSSVDWSNNETFPLIINGAPTDISPLSNLSSRAACLQLGEQKWAMKPVYLAAKGGQDRGHSEVMIDLPAFNGNPSSYLTDITYSALNNTVPGNVYYYTFSVVSADGSNLTNGASYFNRVSVQSLWTDRQFDLGHA